MINLVLLFLYGTCLIQIGHTRKAHRGFVLILVYLTGITHAAPDLAGVCWQVTVKSEETVVSEIMLHPKKGIFSGRYLHQIVLPVTIN